MATKKTKGKVAAKTASSLPKLEVVVRFRDKYDLSILYEQGTILELSEDERIKDLLDRGLVKQVEEICQK